jgi:hypothetical protein
LSLLYSIEQPRHSTWGLANHNDTSHADGLHVGAPLFDDEDEQW